MRAYARARSGRDLFANSFAFRFTVLFTQEFGTKFVVKNPALSVMKHPSMLLLKLRRTLRGRHRRGKKGNEG